MSLTSRVVTALIAVALSACAHQTSSAVPAASYAGGRAAQPGGWLLGDQRAAYEQSPLASRADDRYFGGRASNPAAWLAHESPRQTNVAAASCEPAGRAAQPFSGPSQYLLTPSSDHSAQVACDTKNAERL